MDSPPTPSADIDDLDRYRLPPDLGMFLVSRRKPPRHRPGEGFIRGPVPHDWIALACRLPGAGFHVAMGYRFLGCRFRSPSRVGVDSLARGLQISADSARRGLRAAEMAGLLKVGRRWGRKLSVSIGSPGRTGPDPDRRPLYGPVPWPWWLTASRLPGKALQVAAACWLRAGWDRSATFELALGDWGDLGLSRYSAARGLGDLERAGLVSVARSPGRSPVVTILETGPPGA